MAKYKALQSFKGIVTMSAGEVRELRPADFIVKDLLNAGLIQEVTNKRHTTETERNRNEKNSNYKR